MTIATAWAELAKQERKAHRQKWGTLQVKSKPKPPKQKGRPHGTYNPERLDFIRQQVKARKTNAEIARALDISESSIRYWRAKYDIF